MGQMPDGVRGEEARGQAKGMRAQSATAWTVKSVLRQPSTWLIMVFMTSNFFAWAAMMAHQVAYVTEELGATPMVGAMTMSVVPGASILGGLLFGVLALKFGAKRLAIVSFALYTLALVILLVTKSVPFVFTYAFLFGLSGGAILPVMSTLLADYYGRAIFPKVLGLMNFFIFPFRAAAPTITGAIFDAAGNYALAFIIMAAFSFVGFILSILVSRPKPPELIEKTIARAV
jgi:MFS family permease